jgi:hypothetical protein
MLLVTDDLNDIAERFGDIPQSNDTKVLMELFSKENIKTRTDVSDREISIITRLELYGQRTKLKGMNELLITFM